MEVSKKLKASKPTKNQSTKRSRRAAESKQLNVVPEAQKDHKDKQESLQDDIMEPQTCNMVKEKGAK